jgi:2-dehydropantoate 2-reductase
MRTLIVGAGAVGGYFGGRLLQAGRDVTFFVRPSRAADLAKSGLRVRSPHGDFHIARPPTITAEALRAPFDLIVLSCKAQDLPAVMESFATAVGPGTAILPLLNGMRHLDMLAEHFGSAHVLGGECMISATRSASGEIVQLTDMQSLVFGERDGSRTPRIEEIASTLSNPGFESRLSGNVLLDMWNKWVFITTGAALTCLMRASVGDIVAAGAADLALTLLNECAATAEKEGFPTSQESLAKTRQMFTSPGSPLTASMLRDVENHAPVEADHIIGDLLVRAQKHGLSTPVLRIAYVHLKSYEARRAREAKAGA